MNDFLKAVEEHQKKYSNCGLESKFTKNSTGFGSKTKQYGCFFQTKKR